MGVGLEDVVEAEALPSLADKREPAVLDAVGK
jgi:hypothetical protein